MKITQLGELLLNLSTGALFIAMLIFGLTTSTSWHYLIVLIVSAGIWITFRFYLLPTELALAHSYGKLEGIRACEPFIAERDKQIAALKAKSKRK